MEKNIKNSNDGIKMMFMLQYKSCRACVDQGKMKQPKKI